MKTPRYFQKKANSSHKQNQKTKNKKNKKSNTDGLSIFFFLFLFLILFEATSLAYQIKNNKNEILWIFDGYDEVYIEGQSDLFQDFLKFVPSFCFYPFSRLLLSFSVFNAFGCYFLFVFCFPLVLSFFCFLVFYFFFFCCFFYSSAFLHSPFQRKLVTDQLEWVQHFIISSREERNVPLKEYIHLKMEKWTEAEVINYADKFFPEDHQKDIKEHVQQFLTKVRFVCSFVCFLCFLFVF